MRSLQNVFFLLLLNTKLAICKSPNGESGNEMREMMGMRVIMVGMMGISVGMRRTGSKNEENKGENLCIVLELTNYNCRERQI